MLEDPASFLFTFPAMESGAKSVPQGGGQEIDASGFGAGYTVARGIRRHSARPEPSGFLFTTRRTIL